MSEQTTGTRDVQFDLMSVIYHALEAASTADKYRQDAEREGEEDLVQFFENVIDSNRDLADLGKELLRKQFVQGGMRTADEMVDESSEESFPASDPPSH